MPNESVQIPLFFLISEIFLFQTFFATDWTKVRYPERYSVANNDADAAARSVCCYYRCELKLQASAKFNLASFTGMKIKGIMEYIYCEHGIHLDGRHLVSILVSCTCC